MKPVIRCRKGHWEGHDPDAPRPDVDPWGDCPDYEETIRHHLKRIMGCPPLEPKKTTDSIFPTRGTGHTGKVNPETFGTGGTGKTVIVGTGCLSLEPEEKKSVDKIDPSTQSIDYTLTTLKKFGLGISTAPHEEVPGVGGSTGNTWSIMSMPKNITTHKGRGFSGIVKYFDASPYQTCPPIPDWVADEIKATWRKASGGCGQTESFRILERMVDRLGYGRRENNPSLAEDDS